jgi:hypothetical protein
MQACFLWVGGIKRGLAMVFKPEHGNDGSGPPYVRWRTEPMGMSAAQSAHDGE